MPQGNLSSAGCSGNAHAQRPVFLFFYREFSVEDAKQCHWDEIGIGRQNMLYCIKCGDPIDKGELICDKCGYHFTLVEGAPATVYMEQVRPGLREEMSNGQQGGIHRATPVNSQPVINGRPLGAGQQPYNNAHPAGMGQQPYNNAHPAGMGQQPFNRQTYPNGNQASAVNHGMGQGAPAQRGFEMRPVNVNAAPAQPVKKKKKASAGKIVLIVCGSIAGLLLLVCVGGFFIIRGLYTAVDDMMFSGDEYTLAANNVDTTGNTPGSGFLDFNASTDPAQTPPGETNYEAPVVHEFETDDGVVSGAIRDSFTKIKGDGTDKVTVMVYMNGSNLESSYGCATSDLKEMLNATLSDNVNIVIQTGGTSKWRNDVVSAKHSQRYIIENNALTLVDDTLDQLDITKSETLEDFITFAHRYYPANREILIFWDHGGGAVYGFGYDENVSDYDAALTLDEIQTAIRNSGVKFEMIGFDACLMGSIETACALSDYADYLVASEDFECANGWEYQNWLSRFGTDSSVPMDEVAKTIIADFVKESQQSETDGILALIDLRYSRLLFNAWQNFAYANKGDLLTCNYNMEMHRSDRWNFGLRPYYRDPFDALFGTQDNYELKNYSYAVDLMALANTLSTDESLALSAALANALVYSSSTSGDSGMTGLSVTLPYGDEEFNEKAQDIFSKCGFDETYLAFVGDFAANDSTDVYNWDDSEWSGWDSFAQEEDVYDYDWDDYDWDDYVDNDYGWDSGDYDIIDDFWTN